MCLKRAGTETVNRSFSTEKWQKANRQVLSWKTSWRGCWGRQLDSSWRARTWLLWADLVSGRWSDSWDQDLREDFALQVVERQGGPEGVARCRCGRRPECVPVGVERGGGRCRIWPEHQAWQAELRYFTETHRLFGRSEEWKGPVYGAICRSEGK